MMQLPITMETDKERKERLEKILPRKARVEKMVATTQLMLAVIKGVVNVGMVLSLNPILKRWQLYLCSYLNIGTHN